MSVTELYIMAGEARVAAEDAAAKLQAVMDYITTREGVDEWGVPYIYTRDLRAILEMPPS